MKKIQDKNLSKSWKYAQSHVKDLIIGDTLEGVKTRSSLRNINNYLAFISEIEAKNIKKAESNPN